MSCIVVQEDGEEMEMEMDPEDEEDLEGAVPESVGLVCTTAIGR